jgi:hypothetical protein
MSKPRSAHQLGTSSYAIRCGSSPVFGRQPCRPPPRRRARTAAPLSRPRGSGRNSGPEQRPTSHTLVNGSHCRRVMRPLGCSVEKRWGAGVTCGLSLE